VAKILLTSLPRTLCIRCSKKSRRTSGSPLKREVRLEPAVQNISIPCVAQHKSCSGEEEDELALLDSVIAQLSPAEKTIRSYRSKAVPSTLVKTFCWEDDTSTLYARVGRWSSN